MPASYVLEDMVPVLQDYRGHCDAVTTTAPPRTPGNKLSVEVHADSTLSTTMLMDRSYKELKMQTAEHHGEKGACITDILENNTLNWSESKKHYVKVI